jgi:hypothetical protein
VVATSQELPKLPLLSMFVTESMGGRDENPSTWRGVHLPVDPNMAFLLDLNYDLRAIVGVIGTLYNADRQETSLNPLGSVV